MNLETDKKETDAPIKKQSFSKKKFIVLIFVIITGIFLFNHIMAKQKEQQDIESAVMYIDRIVGLREEIDGYEGNFNKEDSVKLALSSLNSCIKITDKLYSHENGKFVSYLDDKVNATTVFNTWADYKSFLNDRYLPYGDDEIKNANYFYNKHSESQTENEAINSSPYSPDIGMTADEIRNSTWGEPYEINKTTTKYGVSEQWVYKYYSDYRYIYLDDGIVTVIQE